MPKIVGFVSPHLCERGTTTALYDYAVANEQCSNISVIFYTPSHPANCSGVVQKFKDRFTVLTYNTFQDVELYVKGGEYAYLFPGDPPGIDYLYTIKYGNKDENYSEKVPCLIHSVFDWDPHGNHYACVSRQIAENNNGNWLPHIVQTLPFSENGRVKFREKHGIPLDAYVYGRYGGIDSFDIFYTHHIITEDIDKYPNIWFVFVNTYKFIHHSRVLFLPVITDPVDKGDFIRACDAMVHGRTIGETFGLAIAEFISLGKPVLSCAAQFCNDNEHLHLGRDWITIYRDIHEFRQLLWNVPLPIPQSVNPYQIFSAKNIMPLFGKYLGYQGDFEIV
jgi:glycosyltransferase involved in cell wall biosynthesis